MTKPTVGRVILYRHPSNQGDKPLYAGTVCSVSESDHVNLSVFDSKGRQFSVQEVVLFQGEEADCPPGQCCWMTYQRELAAKKES